MSDRVTAEQAQACLEVVDVFSAEYYDQRQTRGEPADRDYALYDFKVPLARMPKFVLDTMIAAPFEDAEYDDAVGTSVQRTHHFSTVHLFHDEALVIGFMRGFRTQKIRGMTTLDYIIGFPDSEGATDARMRCSISATTRNYAQEQHEQAVARLLYHSQLDARLKSADLPPSQKTVEYVQAAAYVQYVHDNEIDITRGKILDLLPSLDERDGERIRNGAVMTGANAEGLRLFLGDLSLYNRWHHGPEEFGRQFGIGDSL